MKIEPTSIPDVLRIIPTVYQDDRGFFFESFNDRVFAEQTGLTVRFVQDNHSRSSRNVLRGLHYQIQQAQGKLVRVVVGAIFDVAVDLRRSSPTFGQWVGYELNAENKNQMWVPEGFGHAFLVLSDYAEVLYKTTDYYAPQYQRSLLWNDPAVGIQWPLHGEEPILSEKDRLGEPLANLETFP